MIYWNDYLSVDSKTLAKQESQITIMLLSITILFLCTHLPSMLLFGVNVFNQWSTESPYNYYLYNVIFQCFVTLILLNHSLNFYFYCLSSKIFQKAAVGILKSLFRIHSFKWHNYWLSWLMVFSYPLSNSELL